MALQIINPLDDPLWDERLLDRRGYSFFHSSAWARVLTETYGFTPHYFIERKRGRLKKVVPVMEVDSLWTGRRGVSLPFTDYCDPIVEDQDGFTEIFEQIKTVGQRRGWDYLELRGIDGAFGSGPRSVEYYGHLLDLSGGEAAIKKKFRSSTLRNIKKAEASGVEVEVLQSMEGIREFYRLNSLTRRDHGLPPQPWKFFENIHINILNKGRGFLVLSIKEHRAISGVVIFFFGETAVYKYGASDKRYQHMRPSNLAMWKGIAKCMELGLKRLCLGRTDLGHQGLKQFKEGWGAVQSKIAYRKFNFNSQSFEISEKNNAGLPGILLRRFPLPILKTMGRLLYRHAG
jgi:hypothetical protein